MRENQQRQLDALRRVQGFVNTHGDALGAITGLEGRTHVDAAIVAIDELTNQQGTAARFIAGQMNRKETLVRQLVQEHLIPVARFARAKLGDVPDFKSLTPRVDPRGRAKLLGAARATAAAIAKYNEAYTTGGFPADQAQQITLLVDQIMSVQAERATLRAGRVNATQRIKEQIAKGMAGVKHLDAVIIKQFASNPGLLAEWRSVSRVHDKPGIARKVVAAPAVEMTTA